MNAARMTRCFPWSMLLVLLAAIAMAAPEGPGAPPAPPARQIPALNAPDLFPRGCVDCHVDRPDLKMDTRLSSLMRGLAGGARPELLAAAQAAAPAGLTLTGKHPDAEAALADIPRNCLECHGATSQEAPPFGRLVHRIHLTGGEQNHFLTLFQGECTHCHKLDAASGEWMLPSGQEVK